MLKHLPNALTLLRLILAPAVAWLFWMGLTPHSSGLTASADPIQGIANTFTAAAVCFVVAALTDLFDGMAARAFNAHSKLGRIIDPIADKALVGLPLIVIAIGIWQTGASVWPVVAVSTAVIVVRDVAMTLIRLTAPDGEGARVSALAKVKTTLELVVVGSMLVVVAINTQLSVQAWADDWRFGIGAGVGIFGWIWLALLVITAALSAYTAFQYLTAKKS